jgi:hypothetical protein
MKQQPLLSHTLIFSPFSSESLIHVFLQTYYKDVTKYVSVDIKF